MKRYHLLSLLTVIYLILFPLFLVVFYMFCLIEILLAPLLAKDWLSHAFTDSILYTLKYACKHLLHLTKYHSHLLDTPLIEFKLFKSPMDRRRRLLWRGLILFEYKQILQQQGLYAHIQLSTQSSSENMNTIDINSPISSLSDINDYMDMRQIVQSNVRSNSITTKKTMKMSEWMHQIWHHKFNMSIKYHLLFHSTNALNGEYPRWDINSIQLVSANDSLEDMRNSQLGVITQLEKDFIEDDSVDISSPMDDIDLLFYRFTPKIVKQPLKSPINEIYNQPLASAESIDEFLEFKPLNGHSNSDKFMLESGNNQENYKLKKVMSAKELKSPSKSCLKDTNSNGSNNNSPKDERRVSFASQEQSPTHSV
eukprot:NODE_488_length_6893_cov_0.585517.p4 type:complete len:367 gc:universal NODE_488_length_6893_cov_0.585517:4747-3647(-)